MSVENRLLGYQLEQSYICDDEKCVVETLLDISQRLKRGIMRESVEKRTYERRNLQLVRDEGDRP